jgi:hypothetical protein
VLYTNYAQIHRTLFDTIILSRALPLWIIFITFAKMIGIRVSFLYENTSSLQSTILIEFFIF